MKAHQADHAVSTMCRVLGLSRSGYYAWLRRAPSTHAVADAELLDLIRKEHLESHGIYGAPRIHAALRRGGVRVAKKRVARLMRAAGIRGITRRRFKTPTTQRDPRRRPAPDLVDRQFEASGPNELWVADITELPTGQGRMFLAMVLDVWSRKVVGWALDTYMRADLVIRALEQAYSTRRPSAVVHHSDQGSQYTSVAFTTRCDALDITLSMGSVGDCYDSAMAESFFATFEVELRRLFGRPPTYRDARRRVFAFIEGFYNHRRVQSSLGYRPPTEFEALAASIPAASPRPHHSRAIATRSPAS